MRTLFIFLAVALASVAYAQFANGQGQPYQFRQYASNYGYGTNGYGTGYNNNYNNRQFDPYWNSASVSKISVAASLLTMICAYFFRY
uniref:Uncharacterized protein n=1 Tax=Acrobeloides nanus TaxID=290746 RepID=A0A914EFK7_9BILA